MCSSVVLWVAAGNRHPYFYPFLGAGSDNVSPPCFSLSRSVTTAVIGDGCGDVSCGAARVNPPLRNKNADYPLEAPCQSARNISACQGTLKGDPP